MNSNARKISVLLLSPQWQYDAHGISTVTRSLSNALWLTDSTAEKISVTCATNQVQGKISSQDVADAGKHNVKLAGVKLPRGTKVVPSLSEIDRGPVNFYLHFLQAQKFDFVIGHVPHLANGAFNIQDFYREVPPRVVLVIHSLPRTELGGIDDELMCDWLRDADMVLSVGQTLFDEVQDLILSLETNQQPKHCCYIPCPLRFLTESRNNTVNGNLANIQNILLPLRERLNLSVPGPDFRLASAVATRVSARLRTEGIRVRLLVAGVIHDDCAPLEKLFDEVKQTDSAVDKRVELSYNVANKVEDLVKLFRKCQLCILPLTCNSPLFGTEALMAAYASVPILVSDQSGIARLLQAAGEKEPIVFGVIGNFENDVTKWTEKVLEKLYNPPSNQDFAEKLRKKLLVDCNIASSQLQFIRYITGDSNTVIRIELEEDATVLQRAIEFANRFNMYCDDNIVLLPDAQQFVAAFLMNLLYHREKIQQNQLDHILPPEVKIAWAQLLDILEAQNRTLTNIQQGCVLLTVFCPSQRSQDQLYNEEWIYNLRLSLKQLLQAIGLTSTELAVRPLGQSLKQPIQKKDWQNKSVDLSSGRGSLGPSSLTGKSMDAFETSALPDMRRLDSWLESLAPITGSDSGNLMTSRSKVIMDQALDIRGSVVHRIAVSETEHIAVLSDAPDIAITKNGNTRYFGAGQLASSFNFLPRGAKEHLVTVYGKEGVILLWDFEQGKSQIVFTTSEKSQKVLSVIDDKTIALCDQRRVGRDSFLVQILTTEGNQWKAKNNLLVDIWCADIYDMCYLKAVDGVSSLVMCSLKDKCVFSVDLIGGRIRWQKSLVDMGQTFQPLSVCADDKDHVFVADLKQHCVHILSGDDGTVGHRIPLPPQNLMSPTSVFVRGNFLYVSHRDESNEKWNISKVSL